LDRSSLTQPSPENISLRKLVLLSSGQDVRRCRDCALCNKRITEQHVVDSMDISLDTLIHMVLWNDEEVLTSKTLWSDPVFSSLPHACVQGLNLQSIVTTLREEAQKRREVNETSHYR
jgi:heterodisulfide reductase subunit C